MLTAEACHSFRDLESSLRPFIARRVASPADVDDVVQDVMLRIFRGLGTLRDEERLGPWAYQLARRTIVDHRRTRRRHPLATATAPEATVADEPDAAAEATELLAPYIAPFVAMLPSPYREALTLTDLEGLGQGEAATMLGVPVSTMKSRVQRGRARLRALFEQCCALALDARGRVVGCEPRPEPVRTISCACTPPAAVERVEERG